MEFQLSEEHKLIRDTARRIARERVAPRAAEIDEKEEYPHDIFAGLSRRRTARSHHSRRVRRKWRRLSRPRAGG